MTITDGFLQIIRANWDLASGAITDWLLSNVDLERCNVSSCLQWKLLLVTPTSANQALSAGTKF